MLVYKYCDNCQVEINEDDLTLFEEKMFCPYCMNAVFYKNDTVISIAGMLNIFEKRMKEFLK